MADDLDRFTHRLLVGALWSWWLTCVIPWALLSWYEMHTHHDPGSLIGGGIVMGALTVVVAGLLVAVRHWWRSRG